MERTCNNCWWSRREIKTLLLHCTIYNNELSENENTYQQAKECNKYTPATEPPKDTQLTIF